MAEPKKLSFNFTDGLSHDAGVTEVSDSIKICYNHSWFLVPKSSGLDANPTYTFEVSDDDINWSAYSPLVVDAAIDQPFDDTHLVPTYLRINYNSQTNTVGTVSFDITLKSN